MQFQCFDVVDESPRAKPEKRLPPLRLRCFDCGKSYLIAFQDPTLRHANEPPRTRDPARVVVRPIGALDFGQPGGLGFLL